MRSSISCHIAKQYTAHLLDVACIFGLHSNVQSILRNLACIFKGRQPISFLQAVHMVHEPWKGSTTFCEGR
ncbi:hypothetical protein SETIT_2G374600v2 [Setaria italica]|uniref:Uncharacterized protein n=2 Tax=Setaria TaxID=4554 RepID=A0A368Q7L1_SETIT|nr:hypothetical protein SETIT_2G374600v2 [Setaria italica]RCV13795.1 hypothetical protein SETIT_2G374600v2 [Setaria italica]TKW35606.1 hypothetical protein SEVIR_2G385600v2 [Setaria viridis]